MHGLVDKRLVHGVRSLLEFLASGEAKSQVGTFSVTNHITCSVIAGIIAVLCSIDATPGYIRD